MKVAINGYGRIGVCLARIISKNDNIELVAINATSSHEMLEYLTKYDSVHWVFDEEVKVVDWYLCIGNHTKAFIFSDRNPENLDFGKYGAEVVFECTGAFKTVQSLETHLKNGVKKVILSSPAKDNMPTFVLWVNEKKYAWENIISNASCTTNCLWPICRVLEDAFGIEKWLVTTIHSYTASQNILDAKHKKDKRRARAAGVNMIPTTTWAAKGIKTIMPELDGKLHGQSVRIPLPNVSLLDANFILKKNSSELEVIKAIKKAISEQKYDILDLDEDFRVSSDCISSPYSSIIASDMIQVVDGNMLKIMAWYDNEWGYSMRMLELAEYIMEK